MQISANNHSHLGVSRQFTGNYVCKFFSSLNGLNGWKVRSWWSGLLVMLRTILECEVKRLKIEELIEQCKNEDSAVAKTLVVFQQLLQLLLLVDNELHQNLEELSAISNPKLKFCCVFQPQSLIFLQSLPQSLAFVFKLNHQLLSDQHKLLANHH